jgi:hypothetical protein
VFSPDAVVVHETARPARELEFVIATRALKGSLEDTRVSSSETPRFKTESAVERNNMNLR